jgi:hypothetical protein
MGEPIVPAPVPLEAAAEETLNLRKASSRDSSCAILFFTDGKIECEETGEVEGECDRFVEGAWDCDEWADRAERVECA